MGGEVVRKMLEQAWGGSVIPSLLVLKLTISGLWAPVEINRLNKHKVGQHDRSTKKCLLEHYKEEKEYISQCLPLARWPTLILEPALHIYKYGDPSKYLVTRAVIACFFVRPKSDHCIHSSKIVKATKRSQITMIGECWSHKSGLILFGHSNYNILSLMKTAIMLHFQVPFLPCNGGIQCIKGLEGHPFRKKCDQEEWDFCLHFEARLLRPWAPTPRHLRHHRHHHNIDSARPRVASGWPLLSTAAPRNTFRCSRASSLGKVRQGAEEKSTARTLYDAATIPSQAGLSETEMETHWIPNWIKFLQIGWGSLMTIMVNARQSAENL